MNSTMCPLPPPLPDLLPGGNYFLANAPGVWAILLNICFFCSGIFSDLLLIRLCLSMGFMLQIINVLTGMPSWGDGAATATPRVLVMDLLVWAIVTGLLHWVASFRLLRDEREIKLRNEEEERIWLFFYRRSGMERLEFQEVVRRGKFQDFRAGETIISAEEPLQRFCLLVEGVVEIQVTYHASPSPARRLYSGAFFDLAVGNVFGVKVGFAHTKFEARASTDCRLLVWSFEAVDQMAVACAPSVGAYWRNMLLYSVAASLNQLDDPDGCPTALVNSAGEREPEGWAEGRARSADFDSPLRDDERPASRVRAFARLLLRSIHPLPPPGIRHAGMPDSGVAARNRALARRAAGAQLQQKKSSWLHVAASAAPGRATHGATPTVNAV